MEIKNKIENSLLSRLQTEKEVGEKNGIYRLTQIKLAYNTNRIEGSQLSEEQTRQIFENGTVNSGEKSTKIDDIIETVNHFRAFDFMLDTYSEALTEDYLKHIHKLLKSNTFWSKKFPTGEYKNQPNIVGNIETTDPVDVHPKMLELISDYEKKDKIILNDLIAFHYEFECIHPFHDGNGRVGRLVLFKECLRYDIVPMIIGDDKKDFYYRGLREYKNIPGYLVDTILAAQDEYKRYLDYFKIDYIN